MLTRQRTSVNMTLMLMIRLQRVGKRNEPTFRIVVTESQNSTKSGKFLEVIGSYDSREKNETKVDADRVKHWISNGAGVSDTLHNLFVSMGIIEGKKINNLPKKSPIVKETEEGEEGGGEEAPADAGDASEESTDTPAEESTEEAPEADAEPTTEEKAEEKADDKAEESKEEAPAEEAPEAPAEAEDSKEESAEEKSE
jgi:small subunit ribosomal protein S16